MIRAILFDMGGTLDGDGLHWLDRFVALYADAGLRLPRDVLRAAFDHAEALSAVDDVMATASLEQMIDRHVGWQLAQLNARGVELPSEADLRRRLVEAFVAPVRAAAAENVQLLADLKSRGLRLGVVSNGCGNVDVLCAELGYSPFLSVVVDSRRAGLYKPDPAIFIYAAAKVELPPSNVMMVGDSFDRDVRPAKSIGMMTAWLEGPVPRPCPDPSLADVRLRHLAELPPMLEMRASA
jgi:putative hydrolase of the HAD superfamily